MGPYLVYQNIRNGSHRRRGEREKGVERVSEEITAEIFPNLIRNMNLSIQESQQTSSRIKLEIHT